MRSTQPDRRRGTDSGKTTGRRTAGQKMNDGKASGRTAAATPAGDAGRRANAGDRRHRERLRELCDEVLASYRAAAGGETMLSATERAEAERVLAKVVPLPRD